MRACGALVLGAALVVVAGSAAAAPRAGKSVIGGQPADVSQWQFIASVESGSSLCTGSVIGPTSVLTAAHCVVGGPTQLTVRTGSASAFSGGEPHGVSSASIAPGWQGLVNDLAILTLTEPTSAPPVELASKEEDAVYTRPGTVLSIAGFGRRNPSLRGKPRLGVLTAAQVFAHGFCPLPSWAICDAGGRSGRVFRRIKGRMRKRPLQTVVCSGDSGGPLVASTPAGPRLVGVAEAGLRPSRRSPFGFVRCGLKGYPSLHTRVAEFLDFLTPNPAP